MSASQPPDSEHEEDQPTKRKGPGLNQRTYASIIDKRIAAAHADGAFDNLRGAGKPLDYTDDSMTPEEDRVGYRLLKNSGFAPPWIELQKTIHVERAKLDSWRTHANNRWSRLGAKEQARLREQHAEQITALNRLILHYNLTAPRAVGQLPMLVMQEEEARLGPGS